MFVASKKKTTQFEFCCELLICNCSFENSENKRERNFGRINFPYIELFIFDRIS